MKRKILSMVIVSMFIISLLPCVPITVSAALTEESFAAKIVELQNTFVDGQYWNKYSSSDYSRTGTVKCKCSGTYCAGTCSCSCGQFYHNGKWYGGQCHGYALKLGYLIFGTVATVSWKKHYNAYNIYAGDLVRINNNTHSFFVYKVVGDTIYYTECNNSAPCQVKWNRTITKSALASKVTYILHNSNYSFTGTGAAQTTENPIHSNTNANVRDGFFTLKNVASGKYLNVYGGSDANGAKVTMWDYDDSTDQQFNVVHKGNGKYKLYAVCSSSGTNRVVDIYRNGATPAAGQVVDLWTPDDDTAQLFYIVPLDDGSYIFELAAKDGYVIAPANASAAGTNGSQLTLQKYTDANYQKWKFCNNNGKETYPVGSYSVDKYTVNTGGVNLTMRSGAGTTYSKVTSVPDGAVLNVTKVSSNWGYTTYGSYSGWVCLDYAVYSPAITSISIYTAPYLDKYFVGEKLDESGLEVTLTYSNNTSKNVTSGFTTKYDFSTAGEKTVTVTYEGFTTSFTVTVEEPGSAKMGVSATASAKEGEEVVFSVSLNEAVNIYDGNFNVVYDNELLKYKSYSVGDALTNQNCMVNSAYATNAIRATFAGTTEVETGNMLNVVFEVIKAENAETEIRIEEVNVYNVQGKEIEATMTSSNAKVMLSAKPVVSAKLTVGNVTERIGETITIPVVISENPGIAGFKLKINYDNTVLTPVSIEKGEALNAGTLTSNLQQSGDVSSLTYISAYWSNPSNVTNNGEMLLVTFKVKDNAEDGAYSITATYESGDVTNQDFEDVGFDITNGSVNVISVVMGDIFNDGKVNAKDGVKLAQYLADWDITFTAYEETAADVFKDGKINAKDGVKLSQYLADWDVELMELLEVGSITFEAGSAEAVGGYVDIPVTITNNSGVAGFKVKLNYDTTLLTPVSITKGEALAAGTMTSNIDKGGDLSSLKAVSVYWSNPANVVNTGVAFTVRFKVVDGVEEDIPVTLSYEEGDICDQSLNDLEVVLKDGKVTAQKEADYTIKSLEGVVVDGSFYAEAEITKNTDRDAVDTIVIAVYKDGILIDRIYMRSRFAKGQTAVFGGYLEGAEGATLKAFVWDSMTSMNTLSNAIEK